MDLICSKILTFDFQQEVDFQTRRGHFKHQNLYTFTYGRSCYHKFFFQIRAKRITFE